MILQDIYSNPNPISFFYKDFEVNNKILLTGHSHQAWPDVAKEGILECYYDAAKYIDDKWSLAFEKADKLRKHIAYLINCDKYEYIALASNTHELLIKFLSSLDLKNKNKIITTDGEFHTIRRQLDILNKHFLNVVKINRLDTESLAERISNEIDNNTACVIISKVMFSDAAIINNLGIIADKCQKFGCYLLVDVYHAINIFPFDIEKEHLENAFILGGGYKYLQFGEGNCFLRIPESYTNNPIISGWFSEFDTLTNINKDNIAYGTKHWRFAGATYDPISHYRASSVIDFFNKHNLNVNLLREINLQQIKILNDEFKEKICNSKLIKFNDRKIENFGGFTVFETDYANLIQNKLRELNVFVDYRGNNLRLGPAPYLSVTQLQEAIDKLNYVINKLEL